MLNDSDKFKALKHLEDLLPVQPEIARALASRLDPNEEPNIIFRIRIGEIVIKAKPGLDELSSHHDVIMQLVLDSIVSQKTSIIGGLISSSLRKLTIKALKSIYLEGARKEAAGSLLKIIKKADAMQINNPFALTPEEWKNLINNRQAA